MESSLFADFSSLSSPLEQVFGHVPKGHDKALRQVIKIAKNTYANLYQSVSRKSLSFIFVDMFSQLTLLIACFKNRFYCFENEIFKNDQYVKFDRRDEKRIIIGKNGFILTKNRN